jgi:hypothetical protein
MPIPGHIILLAMSFMSFLTFAELTPTQAAEAATTVSDRELRQLFPGQFRAIAHGLIRVRIIALADGSLFARQIGKSDTGIWKIDSGKLCIRFSRWLKGRIKCSTVTQQAGWYRTTDVAFKKIGATQ